MRASKHLKHEFIRGFLRGLSVVWPIISLLLVFMALLGLVVGQVEGWPVGDGLYFSFVTGLTIGYGDLVPKHALARFLAIVIGMSGIVMTGLIVAVGVHALRGVLEDEGTR
ncbi:potassium channel family protein [Pseudomonas sp. SCB32]|uniref:potassium channel family protein n=1 Tax=Pseudomonas sp. SCB32 TaxID=2653853 RepID=UPI0012655C8C|nr:potassium channel family protein [Pseudomonas sp. SCB32]